MVLGAQETRSNKEQLIISSQVAQPKCLEEATMKMNNDILTNTIEESLNFPLHPIVWNNEHVHYYVDHWGVEEQNAYFEEPPGEDNTKEALHLVDHPIQLDITPVLREFLNLSVDRVKMRQSTRMPDYLRLGRSSNDFLLERTTSNY